VRAVDLWIPVQTKSALNQRIHWAKRAKQTHSERELVRLIWRSTESRAVRAAVTGAEVVSVSFVRVGPRLLDSDNLHGALKAVRDQVAAELGVSDAPGTGIEWRYGQMRGKAPGVAVEIVVKAKEQEVGP
jgi:hypothetical protein